MKNKLVKIHLFLAIGLSFIVFHCSKSNSSGNTPMEGLTAQNFSTTINEHPLSGDFLGTLETNANASFILISQNAENALGIDAQTGDIFINDATKFDYELFNVIEGTVAISNSEENIEATITVNILDLDDIAYHLTDSKQDYIGTSVGNWISITEAEYNTLASNLIEVSKIGANDIQYSEGIQTMPPINPGLTITNNSVESMIPENNYVFAFKYHADVNVSAGQSVPIENAKVRVTETDIANGYFDLGQPLPPHDEGNRYFVLKGNSNASSASGYLGVCESEGIGYKNIPGNNVYSGGCNASDFFNEEDNSNIGGLVIMYQGLATTIKQWD